MEQLLFIVLFLIISALFLRQLSANAFASPVLDPAQQMERDEHEFRISRLNLKDLDITRKNPLPATRKEVAQRAMQRANFRQGDVGFSLEDIGLLTYQGNKLLSAVRSDSIMPSVTHLRPFAVLHLVYPHGRGTIHFELFDELGTRRFASSEVYRLEQGDNFIAPSTFLRLPKESHGGVWTLRLSIGDYLIAEHEFFVSRQVTALVRNVLDQDGEVEEWLADAINKHGTQGTGMSLEQLLSSQTH